MQDSKPEASEPLIRPEPGLYNPAILVVGQVRRFGDAGPAYEILSFPAKGQVSVEVIYSNERVLCSVDEVLADPIAKTIP